MIFCEFQADNNYLQCINNKSKMRIILSNTNTLSHKASYNER